MDIRTQFNPLRWRSPLQNTVGPKPSQIFTSIKNTVENVQIFKGEEAPIQQVIGAGMYSRDMIHVLVKKRVAWLKNVDWKRNHAKNNTLLQIALQNNCDLKTLEALLKKDPNVIRRNNCKGSTPLHTALIHEADFEVIKFLLEHGADLNLCKNNGNTPLHTALLLGSSSEIINLILEKGPNLSVINEDGKTCAWLLKVRGLESNLSEYDEEFEKRFLLAHTWSIKHLTTMKGETFDNTSSTNHSTSKKYKTFELISGLDSKFGLNLVCDFLIEYYSRIKYRDPDFSKSLEKLLDPLADNILNLKDDPSKILDRFNKEELLIIPSGYKGHGFLLIFAKSPDKDYMFVCNRGGGRLTSSIPTYLINRESHKMDEIDILKMSKRKELTKLEAAGYFHTHLPKKLNFDLKKTDAVSQFFNDVQSHSQKIGNCWFVNPLLGIMPLYVMTNLKTIEAKEFEDISDKNKAYKKLFKQTKVFYKEFAEFIRFHTLKDYLQRPTVGMAKDHKLVQKIQNKFEKKVWKQIFDHEHSLFSREEVNQWFDDYRRQFNLNEKFEEII